MQLSRQFTHKVVRLSLHCLGDCTGLACSGDGPCNGIPVNVPPSVAHDGHLISILQMWKRFRWPARSIVLNKAHTSFAEHGLWKARLCGQRLGKRTSMSPSASIEPLPSSVFPSENKDLGRIFRSRHVPLSMQADHHICRASIHKMARSITSGLEADVACSCS